MRGILAVLLSLLLAGVPTMAVNMHPVRADALLVLEMEVSNTTITIGQAISITLILTNVGNTAFTKTYTRGPVPAFNAYYYLAPYLAFCQPYPYTNELPWVVDVVIAPGANITRTLTWDLYREDYGTGFRYPPPPGNYNLYGCCDLTHPSILDLLTNDVFVPVTVVGDWWNRADINYDYRVDIYDLIPIAAAYGSTPTDPGWNSLCDIAAPYGEVDLFDLVLMASSYGDAYIS